MKILMVVHAYFRRSFYNNAGIRKGFDFIIKNFPNYGFMVKLYVEI